MEIVDTLGVVESRSIAAGVDLADGMVKAASVELIRASTVCSGRYLIFVAGDRDAVANSVSFARNSEYTLAGSYVISHISPQVLAVLRKSSSVLEYGAISVIESRNVSSGIYAADCAVKRSAVQLLKFVSGQGINGKSYFVMEGDVASVREAAEAASESLGKELIESIVIPRPDASVVRALTTGLR